MFTIEDRGFGDRASCRGESKDPVNSFATTPQIASNSCLWQARHGKDFFLNLDRDVLSIAHGWVYERGWDLKSSPWI